MLPYEYDGQFESKYMMAKSFSLHCYILQKITNIIAQNGNQLVLHQIFVPGRLHI